MAAIEYELPATIPTDYRAGHEKARQLAPETAANYVAHTLIGDPLADAMMEDLSSVSRREQALLFQAVLQEQDWESLADAPSSARKFFDDAEKVPDWVDFDSFILGIRMFHRNSHLILGAFVGGTLVEGFATNISKSFFISGKLRDQGVRRLRQNNRHMIEIFMPDGLTRDGDGWKLSVRIRLVHAQLRRLLGNSDEWDHEAWGLPISSAHLGYAITAFSARLLDHMKSLGAEFTDEERKSLMSIWRYTGHVMGIPSSMLFQDEEDARYLLQIGSMCEPPPSLESIVMANALVNSAPLVIDVTDPSERRKMASYVFKVSRALIGNALADQLMYPPDISFGTLFIFRMQERYKHLLAKLGRNRME
ncbi:MAG: oxygenase MpaB family protein, partial [Dehalococcoidia bacterium]|nr:oxygenase MpaB family protein [Dehalococcoidia bacterium]